MFRPRIGMALVVMALFVASCTNGSTQPTTTTEVEQSSPQPDETLVDADCGTVEHGSSVLTLRYNSTTEIATVPRSGSAITVVATGSEPRERLLFDLAAGDRLAMRVTQQVTVADSPQEEPDATGDEADETDSGVEEEASGHPAGRRVSVISFIADVEVSKVTETEFVLVTAFSDFVVEGEGVDKLAAQAEHLESIMTRDTISVSGSLIESQTATTGPLETDIVAAFESVPTGGTNSISPFPDDRLGEGAVWTTEVVAASQGLDFESLMEQTLVSRDGTRLTLDFSSEQQMPGHVLDDAATEEVALTTTGSSVIALDQPGMCRYEATGSGELTTAGSGQTVTQEVEIETTVEPVG